MKSIKYRTNTQYAIGLVREISMLILYILTSVLLVFCSSCRPSPPDLSECTRLEIQCPFNNPMLYFGFLRYEDIFNAQEKEFIHSCNTWVVKDVNVIKAFADDIGKGVSYGLKKGETSPGLKIICYRGDTRIKTLEVFHERVTVDYIFEFRYPRNLPDTKILEPQKIQGFKPRFWCADSLRGLFSHVSSSKKSKRDVSNFGPDIWCDAVVEYLRQNRIKRGDEPWRRTYSDLLIAKMFRCPNNIEIAVTNVNEPGDRVEDTNSIDKEIQSWVSDYAMNPNCKEDSPDDMVFLFEAKAGWNQHGGPELFTFDNHDPRGGCVLFNDHTIKFIRTEEELHNLRWK